MSKNGGAGNPDLGCAGLVAAAVSVAALVTAATARVARWTR